LIPKLSKDELRRIIGPRRRTLEGIEYEEMRLILKLLEPVKVDNSLHCWSETYHYNGRVYEVISEFTHPPAPPFIEELDSENLSDK